MEYKSTRNCPSCGDEITHVSSKSQKIVDNTVRQCDKHHLCKKCGRIKGNAAQPIKLGKDNQNWKGYGDIPNSYFLKVWHRAKQKNRELSVTIEDIWTQFLKQNGKCALSDIDLKFGGRGKNSEETTASLDRINSNVGYTIDNIQWIHKDINRMKRDYDENYFIEMCNKISKKNKI